jgi:mannose/fructose-specific phosphotransferase system component IIA
MSEGVGTRGILVAHGSMAQGLADAVRRISGVDDTVVIPLSNDGKSPQVLQEDLDRVLEGLEGSPAIVFTDLPGGSCALAARLCSRAHPDHAVVTGVNLPILLEFVFNRQLPLPELVPRLLAKGVGSVTSAPEFP